ncbi:MAG: radical SAM protein [Candidatus Margulisiibacteriota bacterium]|nr:MAG: radical SAM protein [Candidatus Margulisbacteria bacterium GWD2_39_127]OGI02755.1 MAG: radical SAM protein [Candidatus Margulisbacteria bacterium GWF2_38_17]OGI09359.1 MAG: radical SAM protein [Candidatus Margulisbacteria bacterium GWE2_39_32]PZM84936.1 MAG: radical SAM protein [Candidatus Margulisiibacteriota bacterium]HAR63658.1 radical SAM protein [Candidatus Margulisiibacteriota bacterium]
MKKFKKIYIEITNVCNLSCDFCPKTNRKPKFMDRDLFERILYQIKGRPTHLYFHVMGEPLLHPELSTFLNLAHKYGYPVNLNTNGILIDSIAESIVFEPALRQVNFSLHSFEANNNQYSIDPYLSKIFEFITLARKDNKISICLKLWNLSDAGKNENNRHILNRLQYEFGIDYVIEDKLTPFRSLPLAENVFLSQSFQFDWPDINLEDISDKGFCYGLRDQVGFLVDGTVVPCCLDGEGTIKLGNILEQEFDEIIAGQRAQKLYEGFSKRQAVEPLCQKCGFRTRFNR